MEGAKISTSVLVHKILSHYGGVPASLDQAPWYDELTKAQRKQIRNLHIYYLSPAYLPQGYFLMPYHTLLSLSRINQTLRILQISILPQDIEDSYFRHQSLADSARFNMLGFATLLRSFVSLEELILDIGIDMEDVDRELDDLIDVFAGYNFTLKTGRVLKVDEESIKERDWIAQKNGKDGREARPNTKSRGLRWVVRDNFNIFHEAQKECLFFTRLSKNIRERVYEHIASQPTIIDINSTTHIQGPTFALRKTCHWSHIETTKSFRPAYLRHGVVLPCTPSATVPFRDLRASERETIEEVHLFGPLCPSCFDSGLHLRNLLSRMHIRDTLTTLHLHWYQESGWGGREMCRRAKDWSHVEKREALWSLKWFHILKELTIEWSLKGEGKDLASVIELAKTWTFTVGGGRILVLAGEDGFEGGRKESDGFRVVQEEDGGNWVSRSLRWTL